jgi:hypothetical protein
MSEILNVNTLDLLTEEEKKFNADYVKKLQGYADGTVDGIQIKNLTAGAATIAKRQQSRSAVAVLKWNMVLKSGDERPAIGQSEGKDEKCKMLK